MFASLLPCALCVKPIREFVVILTKRSYGTKNKKSTFRAKDEMFLWNIETPKITRRIIREFDLTPKPKPPKSPKGGNQ
jgi:hypothetical protein